DTTSMETTQHALSFVPNLPYHSGYALYVTQGWNGSYSHSGNLQYALDFAKSGCKGEQVLAVGDGTVSYRYDDCNCEGCSCNGGWGNAIVIDHGNGDYSKYTHLVYQSIPSWIQVGTPVCRGLHIGAIGSTGNSTGPHLHFQFQSGGALNSPSVPFDRFAETSGVPVEGGGLYTSQNAERSSCGPCSVAIDGSVRIIDDQSNCFRRRCITGNYWYEVASGYDNHHWYTYTIDSSQLPSGQDADCRASWEANVTAAGSYLVEVFVPNNPANTSTKVDYTVRHDGVSSVVQDVNQSSLRGQWVSLGTYHFSAGSEQWIEVTDLTGERYVDNNGPRILLDALRFSPVASCSDDCGAGAKRCSGSNGYESCGNYDGDACLEWGGLTSCPANTSCSGAGDCVSSCSDDCSAGAKRCVSATEYERCDNFDGDACLEWGELQGCVSGQHCESGSCVDDTQSCSSECAAAGLRRCSGNGVQECGDYDDDACFEWGDETPCPSGFVCELGQCQPDCSSECVSGFRCLDGALQQCGEYDTDACLEWGGDTLCESGFVCAGGQCVAGCVDDCVTARCVGTQRQDCGQFDDDPCLDWGEEAQCEGGLYCVDDGQCVDDGYVCSDLCESGARRCEGNVAQSCGDFDGDPCLEWGGELACEAERVCAAGVCELRACDEPSPGLEARGCWGSDAVAICALDERGCWAWEKEKDCAKGSYCMAPGLCAGEVAGCPELAACGARLCGPDPVCQLSCGECDSGEQCMSGSCVPPPGEVPPVEVSGSCSCGLAREPERLPLGLLMMLPLFWVCRRRGRS
ncbi:MAG: peptidoglycan DD-metalloendopeptidase family protein, partial [Myxococcota bacterium]|nr:peptidoglycan DD-metalloendopeptidase family protein [Myxococcota bacterium]